MRVFTSRLPYHIIIMFILVLVLCAVTSACGHFFFMYTYLDSEQSSSPFLLSSVAHDGSSELASGEAAS